MAALRYAPLPRRLLILAAVALLPVVLFASAALVLLARQQAAGIERATVETMRALMGSVDNEEARPVAPPAVSRTVLIVEDNHDARATLRELLETAGHAVHEAVDGPRGLDAALRLRPEVAFVDLGLPGLDGLELARRVRASPEGRGVRLITLTGYGSAADREHTREAGFDVHLVKPVDRQTLERVLAGF